MAQNVAREAKKLGLSKGVTSIYDCTRTSIKIHGADLLNLTARTAAWYCIRTRIATVTNMSQARRRQSYAITLTDSPISPVYLLPRACSYSTLFNFCLFDENNVHFGQNN